MSATGWIGVDLDGTLAHYEGWQGEDHVGAPVPAMLERVLAWIEQGKDVRIFTARVSNCPWTAWEIQGAACGGEPMTKSEARKVIETWCLQHLGKVLPVTCKKDFAMVELWDDRCVQVEKNTGRRMDGQP